MNTIMTPTRDVGGLSGTPLLVALDALDTLRLVAADVVAGADLASEDFDLEVLIPLLDQLLGVQRNTVGSTRRGSVALHCALCGLAHQRNSLWCSDACRRRDKRALHRFFVQVRTTCERCGTPITAIHSDKRFCCTTCRVATWREGQTA